MNLIALWQSFLLNIGLDKIENMFKRPFFRTIYVLIFHHKQDCNFKEVLFMLMMEIFALMFVAIVACRVTKLWDNESRAEKEAARKLMRKGIYGHFEKGEFVFDTLIR